jgi:menaquinone-9 beta-reductase
MPFQNPHTEDVPLDCAVMIVGAGPSGISTWLHLHKYAPELAGRCLVIEKAIFPRDKLCAGAVGGWSTEVLEHLEVDVDIPSLFVSDVDFRFGSETYHFHQTHCFMVVGRIDFDHALVRAAVDRGLELHEDERLIDVIRDRKGLIIESDRRKYRVQILIGADGAHSVVRRKAIGPRRRHPARTLQIFAPVDPQHDSEFVEKKIVMDFTSINEGLQGYVWHIPCFRGGAPAIAHGIGDSRICSERPRADLKKIFSRELQLRHIHQQPTSWFSHPIPWLSEEDSISQPNVLLVGDAAGVEPAFGGGIHLSLSYGEVAAHAIIDGFQKNDFSFRDYQERIHSHSVGRSIGKCTRLALGMYGGKMNPLDAAREVFVSEYDPAAMMRQLLLRYLELHPQSSPGAK